MNCIQCGKEIEESVCAPFWICSWECYAQLLWGQEDYDFESVEERELF